MGRNKGSTGQGSSGSFERKRRRSFGSIRRQRSGRYQASYVGPDRVRYYSAENYEAKADAEGWLRDERRLIEWNEWTDPGARAAGEAHIGDEIDLHPAAVPTFDTYARAWIESRVTTKGAPLHPRTRREYLSYLDSVLEPLASEPLNAISASDIARWHASRSNTPSVNGQVAVPVGGHLKVPTVRVVVSWFWVWCLLWFGLVACGSCRRW